MGHLYEWNEQLKKIANFKPERAVCLFKKITDQRSCDVKNTLKNHHHAPVTESFVEFEG